MTDKGLEALGELAGLETIEIYDTPITNQGLEQLSRLPSLRSLNVHRTKITNNALDQLQRQRPNLKMYLYRPPVE